MRKILGVYSSPQPHWVGDGFPVRSLFSHMTHGQHVSPFLLLDYAGPANFPHEEFHSRSFTHTGGTLEMVQLWVNLPAKNKSAPPGYQTLLDRDIPSVALPDDAGTLRVIAGAYAGKRGPAHTFTPIDLWDVQLRQDGDASLSLPDGHTAIVVVLRGTVRVNGDAVAHEAQFVLLDRGTGGVALHAESDASLLLLSGAPIDEPVVMHGPFVMNTTDEIRQAITDLQSGRFGQIPAA